jgi:hypothetical protein
MIGADPALCDILDYPPQHYVGDEAWARISRELNERRGSNSGGRWEKMRSDGFEPVQTDLIHSQSVLRQSLGLGRITNI